MDYQELASMSRRKVNPNTALPMSLVELMDRIAASEGMPVAQVYARVLRKGLEVERAEREAKAR